MFYVVLLFVIFEWDVLVLLLIAGRKEGGVEKDRAGEGGSGQRRREKRNERDESKKDRV